MVPPGTTPSEPDDRIFSLVEKIVEQKSAEEEIKIRDAIQKRVDEQFDRDRQFIKQVMAAALKVAGTGLILVVFILGALTFTTYRNIHDAVMSAAKSGVEERLKTPETKQTIDDILDQAVLHSYEILIALQDTKGSQDNKGSQFSRLNRADLDIARLVKILTKKDTDKITFDSAAQVLLRLCPHSSQDESENVQGNMILNACAAIIESKQQGFEWAAEKFERRELLLRELGKSSLANEETRRAGRALLAKKGETRPEIRRAAIEYLGEVGDTDAISIIADIYKTDEKFKLSAVQALARLKPDCQEIRDWSENILKIEQPSDNTVEVAVRVTESTPADVGAKLIEYASRKSLLLSTSNPERLTVRVAQRSRSIPRSTIPRSTILGDDGRGSKAVIAALSECTKDLPTLSALVDWLTVRSISGIPPIEVRLRISEVEGVKFEDSQVSAPDEMTLFITGSSGAMALSGSWPSSGNSDKSSQSGKIASIDPKKVGFFLSERSLAAR